ncbi:glycosyltransferase [Pelagibacterium sp. H642]|uniref:glycosyltransferase n=1 Tax=Pelagibacterium sp. H642 TaxID=1881069 RepID=UPI0028167650|nr:glycosyltransferase [Pelagibacterium sp. H642]WMT92830.1 glycosyltransferase [Pelagibacterium sp. H642]
MYRASGNPTPAIGSLKTAVKNVARSIREETGAKIDGFRRRRLTVPVSSVPPLTGTVYFLVGDHDLPAGGIRVIYRHVDILNAAGIPAAVLHRRRGFRCTWFEHETQVTDTTSVSVTPSDLLVVSELDVDLLRGLPRGFPHVVFNQNVHLTWRRDAEWAIQHYSRGTDLRAVVTVSRHSAELIAHAFVDTPVTVVHPSLDRDLFRLGNAERPRRIGYMPRRGKEDAALVLAILRARGVLDQWEVVPLQNLRSEKVGDALRTCRIYMTFAHQEGFGLPAVEAMGCGAYVIGYHGFGGLEHFRPDFSRPVETGDALGVARAIEATLEIEAVDPQWCQRQGRAASQFVHKAYSPQREAAEVVAFYSSLLPTQRSITSGSSYERAKEGPRPNQ